MTKPNTWRVLLLALLAASLAHADPIPAAKCQPDTLPALKRELAESLRTRHGNGSPEKLQVALQAGDYTCNLARHQLLHTCWDEATRLATTPQGPAFLSTLLSDQAWIESLFTSGPVAAPGRALRYLFVIASRETAAMQTPLYKRLATALALQKAEGDHRGEADDYRLYQRFLAYLDAHHKLRLHSSFDALETWDMRLALETGGDDAHFQFLLDDRHYRTGDYYGACWAVAYRLHNQFGDSIHGPLYYRPWAHVYERPEYMRKVGGVCGSLSTFGAMTARAHGLPAMTAGQPGHCAYCVRDQSKRWRTTYNVTWPTTPHTQWWYRGTFPVLPLMEAVHADPAKVLAARRHSWQAQLYQPKISILQPIHCAAVLGKRDALAKGEPVLSGPVDTLDVRRFAPRADHYALRFEGQLDASHDGDYRIHLSADDAAYLKIDGKAVSPAAKGKDAIVKLRAGSHPFQLDFEEHGGRESLALHIEPLTVHPAATSALRLAIREHPLHLGLWNERADLMLRTDTSPDDWKQLGLAVAKVFHDHQEAAWAFIHKYPAAELAKTSEPRELLKFLGECHQRLTEDRAADFIRYPFDRVLNHQAGLLKKDPSAVFDLFRGTLAAHAGSPHTFPAVLAFGKHFDADPDLGPRYRAELAKQLKGDDEQAASLSKVIAANIQEAEKRGDRAGFQSYAELAELTGKPDDPGYIHFKPKQLESYPRPKTFPGTLLSAKGLLQPSSSDRRYDRPLAHPNVLRTVPHGGYFQTAAEEKPHVVVKLEGPGELSGISIINRYESRTERQLPIVVSISEDGKAWTEVFRSEKVLPAWEIDLGKDKPKAAWVRIARDGDKKECFNLRSIRVWGRKLF